MATKPGRFLIAVRVILLLFAAAGAAGCVHLIAVVPPTPDSFYPKCFLYQTTGLHCPGCGTGRAAYFLFNGDLVTAARFNILSLLILPVIAFGILRGAIGWAAGAPASKKRLASPRAIWALVVVIIAFGVLRNIPISPLTLLAPHELGN
jgi:hypothetical protein